jgi:prolyl oligopeptidase
VPVVVLLLPILIVADNQDPFLWLEDVTGAKSLEWVKQQNDRSTAELAKDPVFKELNERLLKILDSKDRIPFVSKAGEFYYNFWRDEKNSRGLWRRTTLDEYRKPEPRWEVVLDLDALGEQERENWVWHGAKWLEPSYDRCLILLSRGGADAAVAREFDPKAKTFIKDGFQLPEAKSEINWLDRDHVFVCTDFGPGSLTESGYPRIVKEWKRGTPLAEAVVVYEGKASDVGVEAVKDHERGYEREFVSRGITFWETEYFYRRDGKLIKIEKPDSQPLDNCGSDIPSRLSARREFRGIPER